MLKFIASLSLAALLSLSPALAHEGHEDGTGSVSKAKCYTPEATLNRFPAKPISQISKPADVSEFVANFNSYVARNGGPAAILEGENDLIILWPRPDNAIEYVTFVKGCAKVMGSFPLDVVDQIVSGKAPPAAPFDQKPTTAPLTKEQKEFSSAPRMKNPAVADDGKI